MKVLLLNQIPEVNNKYTFSLARALRKNNIDVTVYGMDTDDYSEYMDVPHIAGFESYSKIGNPVSKILSYRNSWKKIVSYCMQEKVDIVHVQWYIFSPLDYKFHKILRKKNIKVVTTIHDLLPFNKKFYDFHYHKLIYSKSDKVISQARMNEPELINDFNVDKDKIVYIPHGHYMDYVETATKEESREYLKLSNDKKVILFFGQIKKVKGIDTLIDAMQYVVEKHQDVQLVIAGKVWKDEFSTYENQIKNLNLENYIRTDIKFIPDEEIKYYFNAADVVALPYRQIYQSGVVLLAYAYEKPVVATSLGEFLTVVKNNETGLLVEKENPVQLGAALNTYLDDLESANKMARDGKLDLMERLSWEKIAEQVVNDVY